MYEGRHNRRGCGSICKRSQRESYALIRRWRLPIGRPTATRAVANACGRSRAALAIPCHRVIGSNCEFGGANHNTVHSVDFDVSNWLVPDSGALGSGPKGIAAHFSLHTSGIAAV